MSEQRAGRLTGEAFMPHQRDLPAPPAAPPDLSTGTSAEAILAGVSDGLISVDNEWRLVYVNPAALRMWGRDVGELLGKTVHDAFEVSADNPFRAVYMASKLNNEPVAFSGFSELFGAWVDV